MNLFPHYITRVGGAPYSLLSQLEVSSVQPLIEKQRSLETKRAEVATTFSDEVYQLISSQTDGKIQNKLLNLKRSIFNLKKLGEADMNTASSWLDSRTSELYNEYQELSAEIAGIDQELEKMFNAEVLETRNKLAEMGGMSSIQKGLLLSSQPLLNNVEDYRKQDRSKVRKKELKTEESLVKYLTRMTAKTSPFSTFTNLTTNTYGTGGAKPVGFELNGEHEIYSHISLNNNIYLFLKGLLQRFPEIYRNFELRLNPTLSLQDEVYVFLTNNNNVEAFQRVPYNPVIELFYDFLQEKTEGISYGDMVKEIIEGEYIDAEAPELEEYINQLINFGFIEYNIGVSGIDPFWDLKLAEVLSGFAHTSVHIPPMIESLKTARDHAKAYGKADVAQRRELLQKAHETIREMCMKLHEAAGLPADERKSREELEAEAVRRAQEKKANPEDKKPEEEDKKPEDEVFTHSHNTYFTFKPEHIFYEDTTANIVPIADKRAMTDLLGELKTLVYSFSDFDGFLDEQEKMTEYFTTKYPSGSAIPVMQYYEEFFRDIKVPEAKHLKELKEKKDEKPADPLPKVELTTKRSESNSAKMDAITEMVKAKISDPTLVNISAEELAKILPTKPLEGSFGAFVQPFYENGELKLVANSYFPGFGKMYSRFLHIFPDQLTEDLRKSNAPDNEMIYIENVDASFFNANLHPPLMPFEIWMPGGQNTLPAEKQIPVTDLEVLYNADTAELELRHQPSGKRCYVFDLGFQGMRGRSQLFQLLSKFSPCKALFWMAMSSSVNLAIHPDALEKQKEGPIIMPRIVFNDKIVIQRKRWVIRKEFLEMPVAGEEEWQAFKRVNNWRHKLGLPDEVFVFLTNFGEMETLDAEQGKKIGRDGYKPQYINFNSPLLVNLFDKMLDKVPVTMRIEEMLPGPSGMLESSDGTKWVSEFVIQWSDGGSKTGGNLKMEHAKTAIS